MLAVEELPHRAGNLDTTRSRRATVTRIRDSPRGVAKYRAVTLSGIRATKARGIAATVGDSM